MAPLLLVLGSALLLISWPLAQSLPHSVYQATYIFAASGWLVLFGAMIVYVWRSASPRKALLAASLFGACLLGFIMPEGRSYYELISQLLSLLGLIMVFVGLAFWPPLHPLCLRSAALLHTIRALPKPLFLGVLVAVFIVASVWLAWYCHAFLPIIFDSISQYVHAKFMAAGRLYGESPPLPDFFKFPMMINDGKWYSQYTPLHPFLIALGHLAHAPWLVNPLLGAATLLATYALAKKAYGEDVGRLAAVLVLASPFIVFMSSEYMNHSSALLFTTLFVWCYIETLDAWEEGSTKRSLRFALVGGICLGAVMLSRPFAAAGIAMPFVLHALWLMTHNRRYIRLYSFMALGPLAAIAFQYWYNVQTTGNGFVFPYIHRSFKNMPAVPDLQALPPVPSPDGSPLQVPYTLTKAIFKAHAEWARMNISLFVWSVPCVLLATLAVLQTFQHRVTRLLLAMVVSLTLVNMTNRYESSFFGPRHIFEITTALVVLTAVALSHLPQWLQTLRPHLPALRVVQGAVALSFTMMIAITWYCRLPEWIGTYSARYMHGYAPEYKRLLSQAEPPALVFIEPSPYFQLMFDNYASVAFTNPPRADSPVVFVRDLGLTKNRELLVHYPGRRAYVSRNATLYPLEEYEQLPNH